MDLFVRLSTRFWEKIQNRAFNRAACVQDEERQPVTNQQFPSDTVVRGSLGKERLDAPMTQLSRLKEPVGEVWQGDVYVVW